MEDVGPLGGEAFVEGVGGGGMSQEWQAGPPSPQLLTVCLLFSPLSCPTSSSDCWGNVPTASVSLPPPGHSDGLGPQTYSASHKPAFPKVASP